MTNRNLLRSFILIWFTCLTCSDLAAQGRPEQALKVKNFDLGVLIPLSGTAAEHGEWIRRGLELAKQDINTRHSIRVNLHYQDTQADPKHALSAYKAVRTKYDTAVIFSHGSGPGIALTPLVNRDKVVQIGVATGSDLYSTPDDFTFRNYPSTAQEARHAALALFGKLEARRIAVLQIENDYGENAGNALAKYFKLLGGEVAGKFSFPPAFSDFRSLLIKVKNLQADAIYIASYPAEGAQLLRQIREARIDIPVVATPALTGGKKFDALLGDAMQGLIVVSAAPVFSNLKDSKISAFAKRYSSTYGEMPTLGHYVAVLSYDALTMLEPALLKCGNESECMRNELYESEGFQGVGGRIKFDRNGDTSAKFTTQIYRDGEFVSFDQF